MLTFCCRPNNPTGSLDPLPAARPLVVDEAYVEFCEDEGAVGLLDDGVIVIRTFSKAFGLAGARVGYALAATDVAAELNTRQAPLAVATPSAALALAALGAPPDLGPLIDERERLADELRALGYAPLPSQTNFLYVPVDDSAEVAARLLARGCVPRVYDDAIRITVRDREDDNLILAALAGAEAPTGRSVRHVRATAETTLRVRLLLDGASRVHVATGAGLYDHFLEQLAFHAASTSCSRGPATPRRESITPRRTRPSRSARRSTAHSARAAGSRGTATQSCRWTTPSRALPSISADAVHP